MSAVLSTVVSNFRSRRLQSLVIAVIVMLASGTAALALNLLSESSAPYGRAFADQKGAHLVAFYDPRKVSSDQLLSTGGSIGAAATAGPWTESAVPFQRGPEKYSLEVVGRSDPGGNVAQLRLVSGRWATQPGEIVITRSFAERNSVAVGSWLQALSVPSKPSLRVVGQVVDVGEGDAEFSTQFAWVEVGQAKALEGGQPVFLEMAYRFSDAPTETQLRQATDRLKAASPSGALADSVNYLTIRQVFNVTGSIILILLLAFSVVALAAAAVIVFNVVTGAVIASYQQIGTMKAIGFTPLQAVQVLVGQMLLAALTGCLIGVPVGTVLSQPLIASSAHALGLSSGIAVVPQLSLVVALGALLLVAAAAILAALRAAFLDPVIAMRSGTVPGGSVGRWLRRRVARVPLPLILSLGAGSAVVRPLRALLTSFAVFTAVATITFAYGLGGTLDRFSKQGSLQQTVPVQVSRFGAYPDEQAASLLGEQPGASNVVAVAATHTTVPGISDPVLSFAMRGDSGRLGYQIVNGRWFAGPGEVVTQTAFLRDAHLKVGDYFTGAIEGHPTRLHIVGTDFEIGDFGHNLLFDWATYLQAVPQASATSYMVQLGTGVSPDDYVASVRRAEPDFLSARVNRSLSNSPLTIMNQVVLLLAAVLIVIAVAGCFNTFLLDCRERLREMAVMKAVGMTPAQLIGMVLGSACVLGVVGGLVGTPAGIALHRVVLETVGQLLGSDLPSDAFTVFSPWLLPLLVLSAVPIAIVGALVPAIWAARGPVAEILQAE